MSLNEKLQHKYALSKKGAQDLIKAFVSVTVSDIVLMFPIGVLYYLVKSYMGDGIEGKGILFAVASIVCLVLIAVTTYIQYNATFLTIYVESGVRRISLAEKLRKIPLSFFGKKDLSDLTSAIMSDCAVMETASSHYIPELVGACISTALVALSLFVFDWRMALAAVWVMPVAFLVVFYSRSVMNKIHENSLSYKLNCLDGIQEGLETIRDLRSNNMTDAYRKG